MVCGSVFCPSHTTELAEVGTWLADLEQGLLLFYYASSNMPSAAGLDISKAKSTVSCTS